MDVADPELEVIRRAQCAGVRFLLIGRQACMLYGLPVLSFDYDLWAAPDPDNLAALVAAAREADLFPSVPLERMRETGFFRLENERHIDVHKVAFFRAPDGSQCRFDDAWARRVEMRDDPAGLVIPVPAIEDLIVTKLAGSRKKDLEDVKALRVVLELRRGGGSPQPG
jgi:hypothetical protein